MVWTTDKDGFILNLLAAEMIARTGSDPGWQYQYLTEMFGNPICERIDVGATQEQKEVLGTLSSNKITGSSLTGELIVAKLTEAPGNGAPIGGIKVIAENGWFAVRSSGTEDVYIIYVENFRDRKHLLKIRKEAEATIVTVFREVGISVDLSLGL